MRELELRRLIYGTYATLGIEALVWLTDMGVLSREEAVEALALYRPPRNSTKSIRFAPSERL